LRNVALLLPHQLSRTVRDVHLSSPKPPPLHTNYMNA
jgi:hypothetical protein